MNVRQDGQINQLKAKGSEIEKREDSLIIKQKNGEITVTNDEIVSIEGSKRVGSHALMGMGIGAGVGALTFGLGTALAGRCEGSEGNDCSDIEPFATIGLTATGGLLGGLVGLGVGYLIPKKSKVTITPTVTQEKGETRAGVGLSMPF